MHTIKKIISLIIISLFIILHAQQVFSYTYSEGKNAYDQKNYAKAFRIWYLLSLENDPNGIFGMGLLYKNGFDQLDPSCEYALNYFLSAEKSGINDASYELGDIFEVGKLCKKDKNKALTYYEKAAKNNHLESINRLAESYENGTLGPKDQNKSCDYNDQAASLGDAIGQYRAAKCYKYNLAGKRDFDKAINLLQTVVIQKIEISNEAELELINSNGFKDDELLCEWNEKLHKEDYSEGTYEIAMCYRYGTGKDENLEEARKLFEELTLGEKLTDLRGKLELADMYLEGKGGETRMSPASDLLNNVMNSPNSTDRLIKLARNKLSKVVFGWPECNKEIKKFDDLKAEEVCLRAAENQEICAMIKVSELYALGQSGFEKDIVKSKEWESRVDQLCGVARLPHTGSKSCSGKCEPPL